MQITPIAPARNLLLDCDGVLLDWTAGFRDYAQAVLGKHIDPAGPNDFDLRGWLGCSSEKLQDMIAGFNGGDAGHFGRLEPMPGAIEAVRAAQAQGRTLSIITACSTAPRVKALREQNLQDVFGDAFEVIHMIDLSASKQELLSSFENVSWVEDKAENALIGAELGHKSYLIRSSHNLKHEAALSHPNLTWVDGWDCIRLHEALH